MYDNNVMPKCKLSSDLLKTHMPEQRFRLIFVKGMFDYN